MKAVEAVGEFDELSDVSLPVRTVVRKRGHAEAAVALGEVHAGQQVKCGLDTRRKEHVTMLIQALQVDNSSEALEDARDVLWMIWSPLSKRRPCDEILTYAVPLNVFVSRSDLTNGTWSKTSVGDCIN